MTDLSPRTPCSDRSALQCVPLIGTKATADFHQGAQRSCCNPDAVYMAAAEITPASPETPLPRGSHPYMVRGQWQGPRVRLAMEASNGAGTRLAGVMVAGAEIGEQGIADPAVPPLS